MPKCKNSHICRHLLNSHKCDNRVQVGIWVISPKADRGMNGGFSPTGSSDGRTISQTSSALGFTLKPIAHVVATDSQQTGGGRDVVIHLLQGKMNQAVDGFLK